MAEKQSQAKNATSVSNSSQAGLLQRQCACGTHIGGGECETCKAKNGQLQRAAVDTAPVSGVPPIVHEVLNSAGQPLDNSTRGFMEERFNHDFSGVRVHTDPKANESARAINALAYTAGQHIIFGAGQYAPQSAPGKRLLTHELTHTVQQAELSQGAPLQVGPPHDRFEKEAEQVSTGLTMPTSIQDSPPNILRRVSFGADGSLSPDRRATVTQAATIAEQLVQTPDFAQRFNAFWQGPGQRITPKFTLAQYQAAVKGRIVHDMDTSQRSDVKKMVADDKSLPLERQIAAVTPVSSRDTYMRQFAIDQGIDTVVSLILHESLHGAGATMGGALLIYEPIFHGFEASVGFPMMMGGADIRVPDTAPSDPRIDINIFYVLREVGGEPLANKIELQIVDQATGRNVIFRQNIPSKTGLGQVTWQAHSPPPGVYSVRLIDVNTNTLLSSHQLTITPPSPTPSPPTPPPATPPVQQPAPKPGIFERIKKWLGF